jgi:hypothetical protein
VRVTTHDFVSFEVFGLNLALRRTVPSLQVTIVLKPATLGLTDQAQVFALVTTAENVTVPPLVPSLLVETLVAAVANPTDARRVASKMTPTPVLSVLRRRTSTAVATATQTQWIVELSSAESSTRRRLA